MSIDHVSLVSAIVVEATEIDSVLIISTGKSLIVLLDDPSEAEVA